MRYQKKTSKSAVRDNPAIVRKKHSQLSGASLAISVDKIERRIFLIRGHKVMIDSDLAELYRVTTGNLNLAVRRT